MRTKTDAKAEGEGKSTKKTKETVKVDVELLALLEELQEAVTHAHPWIKASAGRASSSRSRSHRRSMMSQKISVR